MHSCPPKRLSIQLAKKVYKKLNIIIIWFNNLPVDIYRKYHKRESNKSCHHFLRPKGRNNLSVYKSADEGLNEMQSIQTLKHSPDVERNAILTRATTQAKLEKMRNKVHQTLRVKTLVTLSLWAPQRERVQGHKMK